MEGRYTLLPLRDTLEGSVMNEREWALPGLLAEAVNAVTAPGRSVTAGLLEPDASNFALNMMGGGLLSSKAIPKATGSGGVDIGMFVGQKSQTADLPALDKFYGLIDSNVPPAKAYQQTGWMYGAEGIPKYEISDMSSKINLEFMSGLANQSDLNLGQVLSHPELYKAYPELKNTKFLISDKTSVAAYSPDQNTILVNPKIIDDVIVENNPQRLRNILLHELQHNVQKIEGFERGGTVDMAKTAMFKQKEVELGQLMSQINKLDPDSQSVIFDRNVYQGRLKNLQKQEVKSQDVINEISQIRNLLEKTEPLAKKYKSTIKKYRNLEKLNDSDLYNRLAGEAEARLTQNRQNMSAFDRKEQFPFQQLDVPYNELIFRSLLGY
jgi:hypothetical protein